MNSDSNRPQGPQKDRPRNDDDQYPGYPHYPAEEDITSRASGAEQVNYDVDNLGPDTNRGGSEEPAGRPVTQAGRANPVEGLDEARNRATERDDNDDDPDAVVTEEERMLLDRAERGVDNSDDETAPMRAQLDETDEDGDPLNEASGREGYLGDDLVVPGSEQDDANENIGEEDEENNYYSLGSDDNDNLEDNGSN